MPLVKSDVYDHLLRLLRLPRRISSSDRRFAQIARQTHHRHLRELSPFVVWNFFFLTCANSEQGKAIEIMIKKAPELG